MILCFSGNGNSLAVAQGLAERLGEKVTRLRGAVFPMPESDGTGRCVWVMPVYSWGMPPVVSKYIEGLSADAFIQSVEHHLVLTCGDDTGLTHRQWREAMAHKGWATRSASSVQMPNTYTLLPGFDVDPPELAAAKLAAMPARLDTVCATISSGKVVDDVVTGGAKWLKSKIVYPLFVHCDIHPSKFRSTEACISCGRCARACPLDNIEMVDGRPRWGTRCTLCLGCYNACPTDALQYGRRTRGKGRFRLQ